MSDPLPAFEKLGAFYLGRPYDLEERETLDAPLLYDSQDLLTHAVCVGMTGSGKTGLCISLLEEAAIDGVPALIVDPKGDLGNLMLTFPDLAPADFEPWVDEGEAARKGQSAQEYAAAQAALWKKGLGKWGQDGERIRRLRQAAEVTIYTPGSEAGLPISILGSLARPGQEVLDDAELLGDRVETLASSLLGLLGIDADPLRSREHILLSTVLAERWKAGVDLDLAGLIQQIQSPSVERIGVMELETFFPSKDRFQLALSLNNLMAAPGMATWLSGTPLDIDSLLYDENGRPRLAVLSIGHLSESERMFFVSLLLNETVGWMRGRSGTTSLQALLYFDEVFGYLPPTAAPPSKKPLLTLLKQARAYGLGVVLATQNPADLDYKALSNAGTWFLGRLQTERDKLRVLEGLEGAAASSGQGFQRAEMEQILAGLGKRIFLLHNVHESEPVLFHTRWAMSYLRGPLTRGQIKELMAGRKASPADPAAAPAASSSTTGASPPPPPAAATPASPRPVLPADIPQTFYLGRRRSASTVYEPSLLGHGRVQFVNRAKEVVHEETVLLRLPLDGGEVDWRRAVELSPDDLDLERDFDSQPEPGASFADLPAAAAKTRSYSSWSKDLSDDLYRGRRLELWASDALDQTSRPGESEREFRIRLADAAREARDAAKEKLRQRYASKLSTQEDRVRRAEQKVERESEQASQTKRSAWLQVGNAVASVLLGRKRLSATNMRRASTAIRGMGRTSKETQDIERAEEDLKVQQERLQELTAELDQQLEALAEQYDPLNLELETQTLRPRRSDVEVRSVRLAWWPQGER